MNDKQKPTEFQHLNVKYKFIPAENKVGYFVAFFDVLTFKAAARKLYQLTFFDDDVVDGLYRTVSITDLLYFMHYCFTHESDKHHNVVIEAQSLFFVLHDILHSQHDFIDDELQVTGDIEVQRIKDAIDWQYKMCGRAESTETLKILEQQVEHQYKQQPDLISYNAKYT